MGHAWRETDPGFGITGHRIDIPVAKGNGMAAVQLDDSKMVVRRNAIDDALGWDTHQAGLYAVLAHGRGLCGHVCLLGEQRACRLIHVAHDGGKGRPGIIGHDEDTFLSWGKLGK